MATAPLSKSEYGFPSYHLTLATAPKLMFRVQQPEHARVAHGGLACGRQMRAENPMPTSTKITDIQKAELLKDLVYTVNNAASDITKGYSRAKSYWTSFSDDIPSIVYFRNQDREPELSGKPILYIVDVHHAISDGVVFVRPADVFAGHYAEAEEHWNVSDPESPEGLFNRYCHIRRANHLTEYTVFGHLPEKYYIEVAFDPMATALASVGLFEPDWHLSRGERVKMSHPANVSAYYPFNFGNLRGRLWYKAIESDYSNHQNNAVAVVAKSFAEIVLKNALPNQTLRLGPAKWQNFLHEYVEREIKAARSMESVLWLVINDTKLSCLQLTNTFVRDSTGNAVSVETEYKFDNAWCKGTEIHKLNVFLFGPAAGETAKCRIKLLDGRNLLQTLNFQGSCNSELPAKEFKPFSIPESLVLEAEVVRSEAFAHKYKVCFI